MSENLIVGLISATMIGTLFFIIKLVGYFFEKLINKGNGKKTICGKEYVTIKDTKDELRLGGKGKSYVESTMVEIIKEVGSDYDLITFMKGDSNVSAIVAKYKDGTLTYNGGRQVNIKDKLV